LGRGGVAGGAELWGRGGCKGRLCLGAVRRWCAWSACGCSDGGWHWWGWGGRWLGVGVARAGRAGLGEVGWWGEGPGRDGNGAVGWEVWLGGWVAVVGVAWGEEGGGGGGGGVGGGGGEWVEE